MKVTTKGAPSAQYVGLHANPSSRAFADTSTVLSAYLEALSSLLAVSSQDVGSENMMKGMYQNYATLKQVRSEIDNDLAKADVALEAIEARLAL